MKTPHLPAGTAAATAPGGELGLNNVKPNPRAIQDLAASYAACAERAHASSRLIRCARA